jgi:hypothetical protein
VHVSGLHQAVIGGVKDWQGEKSAQWRYTTLQYKEYFFSWQGIAGTGGVKQSQGVPSAAPLICRQWGAAAFSSRLAQVSDLFLVPCCEVRVSWLREMGRVRSIVRS